jgi:hypothetical protein
MHSISFGLVCLIDFIDQHGSLKRIEKYFSVMTGRPFEYLSIVKNPKRKDSI